MSPMQSESIQRGNVLLYESGGKWYEELIRFATHGPFVHAAIALAPDKVIEATGAGIAQNVLQTGRNITVIDLTYYTTPERIEQALAWAEMQAGRAYSWIDIIYQGLKFMWPNNPLRFGVENQFDCSDFAARYIQHAGVILPSGWDDPYSLSPCDIARIFGLLPVRKPSQAGQVPIAQSGG